MSKYGKLSRTDGHSKWFLQRTLEEHDRSMDHPWMQMIYKQAFGVPQYAAWLARNHAVFDALERRVRPEDLPEVHDPRLLRTAALETDLQMLLGPGWRAEAEEMAAGSPATQRYLERLAEDAGKALLLLAHHFLQYNAVLSGGAYLGKMVAEKLSLVRGAPGVAFYAFRGVDEGKEASRVQEYLRSFDKVQMDEQERDAMLEVMRHVYSDTEAMMQEVYDLAPGEGLAYSTAKDANGDASVPPPPCDEQLTLTLAELRGHTGGDGGRILFSLAGELLDVSAGRELYGPGGSYALLAGRDVTRCLGTMSLEASDLDDLTWEPDDSEEEKTLAKWREKLKLKYPVAGTLAKAAGAESAAPESAGLRQRAAAAPPAAAAPAASSSASSSSAAPTGAPAGDGGDQKCPISGKVGAGCPMAMFGVTKPAPKAKKAPAKPEATTGFMAGKSLLAAMEKTGAGGGSSDEWWLSRLCPLHWDDQTSKAFVVVAAMSWLSGIFIGWNLHKQIMA